MSSLLELSARAIKFHRISFNDEDLPRGLSFYLKSAQQCVNPKCCGVYFESRLSVTSFKCCSATHRIFSVILIHLAAPFLNLKLAPLLGIQLITLLPRGSADSKFQIAVRLITQVDVASYKRLSVFSKVFLVPLFDAPTHVRWPVGSTTL